MSAKAIFIGEGFSNSEQERIRKLIQNCHKQASRKLGSITAVSITFYRFGKHTSGFTQAKDWVKFTLPKGPVDYEELEATLYHKLHHTVRGYAGYLEEGKHFILNSLFSEGLANVFQMEQVPTHKLSSAQYTQTFIDTWLPKMKADFYDTKNYRYAEWFHGKGTPPATGYRVGTYLVHQIQKKHPKLSHKDLVRKPARELLKLTGVKV